jgi:hypothetical protein
MIFFLLKNKRKMKKKEKVKHKVCITEKKGQIKTIKTKVKAIKSSKINHVVLIPKHNKGLDHKLFKL